MVLLCLETFGPSRRRWFRRIATMPSADDFDRESVLPRFAPRWSKLYLRAQDEALPK
jgi:hypothetical protein